MDVPAGFEIIGRRALYRPVGVVSLDEAAGMVATAIARSIEKGATELLADIRGLTGFPSPNTTQQYFLATEWATSAQGRFRLAIVARPETMDSARFGETVAYNRGLVARTFVTEGEAAAWLDGERPSARS